MLLNEYDDDDDAGSDKANWRERSPRARVTAVAVFSWEGQRSRPGLELHSRPTRRTAAQYVDTGNYYYYSSHRDHP